jgi:pullulanase/glycogen debranching enzyme
MIAFRRNHPILRQQRFLHARERALDGLEDLFWWRPDGTPMTQADWDDPEATRAVRRASDGLRHTGPMPNATMRCSSCSTPGIGT